MTDRDRIVSALCAEDGSLRRAGLALVIDHVLAQPLSAWLDADAVTGLLVEALTANNSARVIERHVLPGLGRVRGALRTANETVGGTLPESARAKIEQLVTQRKGPRFAWLGGALDRDKIRALLAPALQEVFVNFGARMPLGGRESGSGSAASAAAGFVGRLGRGTGERLLNLGKSVADGFGVDIEARLREAARDYSQGAVAGLQRAIATRLATPEAATLIEGLQRSVLEHVLATPVSTILDDLDRLPLADAIKLASPILEHDLARGLWRSIVSAEVHAVLELESARTLRELLEEAGLLTGLRSELLERGDGVARTLFASQEFAAWLERVLDEAKR
jgi:hypothetical protein